MTERTKDEDEAMIQFPVRDYEVQRIISDHLPTGSEIALARMLEASREILKLFQTRPASPAPEGSPSEEIEVTDVDWVKRKISCRALAEWIAEQATSYRASLIQRVAAAIQEDRKATTARAVLSSLPRQSEGTGGAAKVREAWLYHIQVENECGADGKPCHSHKCGCALEMQGLIDGVDHSKTSNP